MTSGDKLREARGEKSQQQVADDLGISVAAVCSYENDTRVPRDKLKKDIAEYYGRTVQDLFF